MGWSPPQASAAQPSANRPGAVTRIANFDESRDQSPEGITVGHDGRTYVSWKPLQQLVRLDDGHPTVVATLPGKASGIGGLVGLATAPDGAILGALASTDGRYNGVWSIRPDGAYRRLASLPTSAFPNDIVLTPDGASALVTDSTGGRVYRVRLADGRTTVWLSSTTLKARPGAEVPVGANGITFLRKDEVVVANYDKSTLLAVPVAADGSAGSPSVTARVPQPDGVRAYRGELYVAEPFQNQVVRISPDGTRTILADALQGLDRPFSLLVRDDGPHTRLLVTDGSVASPETRPGVTRIGLPAGR